MAAKRLAADLAALRRPPQRALRATYRRCAILRARGLRLTYWTRAEA